MLRACFIPCENVTAALRMYRELYPNVRQPNHSPVRRLPTSDGSRLMHKVEEENEKNEHSPYAKHV